jgi:hypothetical protein
MGILKCILMAFAIAAALGLVVTYVVAAFGGSEDRLDVLIPGGACALLVFVNLLLACRRSELTAEDLRQRVLRLWELISRS